MSESRLQGKVGLFLVLGIVLIGVLLLNFSKGASIFTPTYQIRLKAANVGGLKARSAVFVSGVEVGNVMTMELDKDGKTVLLQLKIQKRYPLHRDATFVIEQIGVLGDQFVAIYPGDNSGPLLKDGEEVQARPAFNLQEVARSASELIKRYDKVGEAASEAITRLNDALNKALATQTIKDRLALGASEVLGPTTPEQADAFGQAQRARWVPFVRALGIDAG